MKCKDLLSLSSAEQEVWLEKNVQEYMEKVWDADHLGIVYHIDLEEMHEDYISSPEAYETGFLIQKQYPSMSDLRATAINNGAKISDFEKKYLKAAIFDHVQDDGDNGFLWLGYDAACDDGNVFALFLSVSGGQGGPDVEFSNILPSKSVALSELKKQQHYVLC